MPRIFIITMMVLEGTIITITSRDQYVKINNGGLLSQKMLKLLELQPKESLTKMRFPKTTNK